MKTTYEFEKKTHKGHVREQNEDFSDKEKTQNGDLFIVCDGMGGQVGGQVASRLAVESIIEFFSMGLYPDIQLVMNDALNYANHRILEETAKKPELRGMGTTVVLLILKNDQFYYAHAGDSRIYKFENDKLTRITEDHSYVQSLVNNKIITEEEAEVHPKKNQILKALGVKSNIEATICDQPTPSKTGNIFLLCSDGLSGMVNDPMIQMVLADKTTTLENKASKLLDFALSAGGKDNITLQLIQVTQGIVEATPLFDTKLASASTTSAKPINSKLPSKKILMGALAFVALLLFGLVGKFAYDKYLKDDPTKIEAIFYLGDEIQEKISVNDTTEAIQAFYEKYSIEGLPSGTYAVVLNYKGKEIRRKKEILGASQRKFKSVILVDNKLYDLSYFSDDQKAIELTKKLFANTDKTKNRQYEIFDLTKNNAIIAQAKEKGIVKKNPTPENLTNEVKKEEKNKDVPQNITNPSGNTSTAGVVSSPTTNTPVVNKTPPVNNKTQNVVPQKTTISDDFYALKKGDKWCFVDKKDKEITNGFLCDETSKFTDKLAFFRLGNKWGLFEKGKGKGVKITALYVEKDLLNNKFCKVKNEAGLYGVINLKGKLVIPCIYESISEFNPQKFCTVLKGGKPYWLDENGNPIKK